MLLDQRSADQLFFLELQRGSRGDPVINGVIYIYIYLFYPSKWPNIHDINGLHWGEISPKRI